ncbi:MAG: cell division protein FtsH [Lentisphaerae bacterium GWF2_57_35]|nr:MAG: cell division protein FtsH [Lentisphaerae bacterium GWF2_57_35]
MPFRGLAIWLLLLALFLTTFQIFSQRQEKYHTIAYSPDLIQLVEKNRIKNCEVIMEVSGLQYIRGETLDVDEATGKPRKFKVDVPVTDDLIKMLRDKNVSFQFKTQNPYLWQVLSGAVPFLLVLGLLYFLFVRQMKLAGKGAMSFGKSRARLMTRDKNTITFEDVAGVDEAKDEVQEIIEFLKDPKRFQKLGGRIPKGVLLVGPPGTGKTLLAKAIAGEAQVPFFSISGSDFVEMFVGVGASRVRDMFEQGKKNAPCIIFIDEIDAVGRSRFSGIGGGHDEREQTLNALLVEMDGFDTQEGVIIIAATNRPDVLDQALLRPGRFDRQIVVDLPGLEGREAILKIHSRRVKLATNADLRRVARGTPGFSGADLSNLINEAALLAARRGAEGIEHKDLEEARDKVRWGRERRSRILDDKEKKLTAYHESGHAIVLQLVGDTEPLHKVTIIPRGASLGSTMQLPEKDRYTESQRKLISMITGLMGGRSAEELVFGDVTTGASSDLRQASHIARMMVCEWGMSPALGPQSFGEREELLFLGREVSRSQEFSEETARKIDEEVTRIIRECHARAVDILKTHRDRLDMMAQLLIERETLDGRDVADIVEHGRLLSEVERTEQDEKKDAAEKEEPSNRKPIDIAPHPMPQS